MKSLIIPAPIIACFLVLCIVYSCEKSSVSGDRIKTMSVDAGQDITITIPDNQVCMCLNLPS